MSWTIRAGDGTEGESEHEKQLKLGIEAEMEHADTIKWLAKKLGPGPGYDDDALDGIIRETAQKIAEDHLKEMPDYYSKLKAMEGSKPETDGNST